MRSPFCVTNELEFVCVLISTPSQLHAPVAQAVSVGGPTFISVIFFTPAPEVLNVDATTKPLVFDVPDVFVDVSVKIIVARLPVSAVICE